MNDPPFRGVFPLSLYSLFRAILEGSFLDETYVGLQFKDGFSPVRFGDVPARQLIGRGGTT